MARGYLDPSLFDVSEYEKRLARKNQSAVQDASTFGSTAGSLAGGALGALSLATPLAPAAPALIGLGSAAGNLLGGLFGAQEADRIQAELAKLALKRRTAIENAQLRSDAASQVQATR